MNPEIAALFTKCATCGHPALNHAVYKGKRRHCCHGDSKSICRCKLYVAPEDDHGR